MEKTTADIERERDLFVQREVLCNVTGLVTVIYDLDDNLEYNILRHLYDYRTPAEEAGWSEGINGKIVRWTEGLGEEEVDSWEEACANSDSPIEPEEREVFQWLAVSQYLADELRERGETVMADFYGLEIWGRTTYGQAISMDSVIRKIYNDLHNLTNTEEGAQS